MKSYRAFVIVLLLASAASSDLALMSSSSLCFSPVLSFFFSSSSLPLPSIPRLLFTFSIVGYLASACTLCSASNIRVLTWLILPTLHYHYPLFRRSTSALTKPLPVGG
ncbi:hypothetical protein XAUC_40760 [Xanthomonas citri pv. aurantifolii str. ICPB 10535]|nr:hypothetical protein XAUC_40760 [Xanthomonas citri pv. aurantifolii str. ICPB 10535]